MGKRKVSEGQPKGKRNKTARTETEPDAATAAAGTSVDPATAQVAAQPAFKNKEKVLILSSRGIIHSKKDSKLDTKSDRGVINEVADMAGCSSVIFFEARKHKDLYLWLAKSPQGPSIKFHVTNVHTMAELKLSGNHLKSTRPVLSFHPDFDAQPHWQVVKEVLTQMFVTPKKHHKSKPFFDHVISFHVADDRIWIRNYQVVPAPDGKNPDKDISMVEVGPRCCLNPIRIFGGSFGGPVLYENPGYVSPNAVRAVLKKRKSAKYGIRVKAHEKRRQHLAENPPPVGELSDVFK